MLRDLNPNEEEVLVVTTMKTEGKISIFSKKKKKKKKKLILTDYFKILKAVKTEVEEDEPSPPEPFEYPFDD